MVKEARFLVSGLSRRSRLLSPLLRTSVLNLMNLCIVLHENPTNGLVADTVSRTEGRGLDARCSYRTPRNWDTSFLSRRSMQKNDV
jgi:hypothetical protein